MSDENRPQPLTEEQRAGIRRRWSGVSLGEWSHGFDLSLRCNAITCDGQYLFLVVHPDLFKNERALEFLAYARQDMYALLQEVERLWAENEVLEEALDSLGDFIRYRLDYCAADFVGEGIDYAPCKCEYNPEEGNNRCFVNCWAEAFKKQAEKRIRAMKELEGESHE